MPRITLALFLALLLCGSAAGQHAAPGRESPARISTAAGSLGAPSSAGPAPRDAGPALVRSGARDVGPLPLPPPKAGARRRGEPSAAAATTTAGNVATVVLSSLAIVLGLFFFVVWLSRRAFPKATGTLSKDVLEVVGRAPLASRHHLQLIRLGHRLLLVSVTPDHAETLTEITDLDETNHLLSLCRQQQPGSISDSFRQVLQQLGASPDPTGSPARAGRDELGLTATGDRRRG